MRRASRRIKAGRLRTGDGRDGNRAREDLAEGGAINRRGEQVHLGRARGVSIHVMHHGDQDVALQHALREALDGDLRDDPRGLVCWDELSQPIRQRHDGEQPERLEEHEKVEGDHSKGDCHERGEEDEGDVSR